MKTEELRKLLSTASVDHMNGTQERVHEFNDALEKLRDLAPSLAASLINERDNNSLALDAIAALLILTHDRGLAAVPDDVLKWACVRMAQSEKMIDDVVRAAINMPRKENNEEEKPS